MIIKSRKSLKQVNIVLDALEQRDLTLNGNYISYKSGSGDLKIECDNGSNINLSVGGAVKMSEFDKIRVTNLGTSTTVKSLIVGYGETIDAALAGSVNVSSVDNPVEISGSNPGYYTSSFMTVSSGGYPGLQLWNPSGSGKILKVTKAFTSNGGSHNQSLGLLTTEYNAQGVATKNKDISTLPDSVAHVNIHENASMLLGYYGNFYGIAYYDAKSMIDFFKPKYVRENEGLYIESITTTNGQTFGFEWEEI